MAALVTLDQAKAHLGVNISDSDADIQLKVEQASAIILDYLKGRANVVATISSNSVAVASVVTTTAAHGFTTGDTAVITGNDSTPEINGSYTVTVLTTTTFSVPVTVTVAGTTGTATVAWSDLTAPGQVQAAVLLMLTHLYERRGDDMKTDEDVWQAIGRLLMRSRDPAFA